MATDLSTLTNLIHRLTPPSPWAEGEKIPWNEPGFSRRMLDMHLCQDHDWASRRLATVEQHLDWLERNALSGNSRVLDLGCGPGLYLNGLAQRGHEGVGIDFSPASIDHAQSEAAKHSRSVAYRCADVRQADYGTDFDMAMMIFGELNVFRPEDTERLLAKAYAALNSGGILVIEPHTYDEVHRQGEAPAWWQSVESGLFSESPHLWLQESFWHEDIEAATTRYLIVDAATAAVTRYASTMKAYTDGRIEAMLLKAGFDRIERFSTWTEGEDPFRNKLQVFTARKG